jgi:hypothetical protein
MAAPTNLMTQAGAGYTGTITTSGEANGLLLTVPASPTMPTPRVRFSFGGTTTSPVVAIRGLSPGLTLYTPVPAVSMIPGAAIAAVDSTAIDVTTTQVAVIVDVAGLGGSTLEIYVVSGTFTSLTVEAVAYNDSRPLALPT